MASPTRTLVAMFTAMVIGVLVTGTHAAAASPSVNHTASVFSADLFRPTWSEDKMPTMSENEWRELYLRLGSSALVAGAESASGAEKPAPLRGETAVSLGLAATKAQPARRNLQCSSIGQGIFACCAPIRIESFNFDQRVCVQLTAHPETASATLDLQLDGVSLLETTLAATNPPPLCVPVPQFPPLTLCVRAYDLGFAAGGVRFCINLEAQLGGVPLLVLRFQCVRVNPGGVSLEPRPPNSPFFSLNFGGASRASATKERTEEIE